MTDLYKLLYIIRQVSKRRKNSIQDSIQESYELDSKTPRSDKVFNFLGLFSGSAALILLSITLLVFVFARDFSVPVWYFLFYPILVSIILGLYCCIGQIVRNRFLSIVVGIIFNGIALIAVLVVIIVQSALHTWPFIFPLYFL